MTLPPRPRPDFGPRAGFPASVSPPVPLPPVRAPTPAPTPRRAADAPSPNWIPDRPAAPPREGVALADALRLANPRMPSTRSAPPPAAGGVTGGAPDPAGAGPVPNRGELSQVYNRARVLAARRQALSDWLGPVLGPRVRLSNVRSQVAVVFVDSASLAVALRRKHAEIISFLVSRGTGVTTLDIRIAPAPGQGATQLAAKRGRGAAPRPFG